MKTTTPESLFPKFDYYLDESDPDIVILRRQDDSFVAAFSARGVTKEGLDVNPFSGTVAIVNFRPSGRA
jgi:hypothetical protein